MVMTAGIVVNAVLVVVLEVVVDDLGIVVVLSGLTAGLNN